MGRLIKLTAMALVLGSIAGCHHWEKRRVAAVSYGNCCDPWVAATWNTPPVNALAGPPVVSKVLPYATPSPQYP
jgi:hypothetical protein